MVLDDGDDDSVFGGGRMSADRLAEAISDAVELWTRRTKAIDAGALRICRFHALKKDSEKMLSDW